MHALASLKNVFIGYDVTNLEVGKLEGIVRQRLDRKFDRNFDSGHFSLQQFATVSSRYEIEYSIFLRYSFIRLADICSFMSVETYVIYITLERIST